MISITDDTFPSTNWVTNILPSYEIFCISREIGEERRRCGRGRGGGDGGSDMSYWHDGDAKV